MILDGHARLAAAIAESVEPPLLQLIRTAPDDEVAEGTERAVGRYETEMARRAGLRVRHGDAVPDGAALLGQQLAHDLRELDTARRPSRAWALEGGQERWLRIAHGVSDGQWPPA
ncbi:hypothetical protein AB0C52_10175 [Streptomyces sp. NPDC048717]|uniref:hypothetical protein n=1 Tax=Streptomyces sp. NPDC048717 TaxID=3154928 RepID=UPI00344287D9